MFTTDSMDISHTASEKNSFVIIKRKNKDDYYDRDGRAFNRERGTSAIAPRTNNNFHITMFVKNSKTKSKRNDTIRQSAESVCSRTESGTFSVKAKVKRPTQSSFHMHT